MLPVSAKVPVRFTPEHYPDPTTAPVYLLAVPTTMGRVQFDRDCRLAGCAPVGTGELQAGLRAAVVDLLDGEERAAALGWLGEWDAHLADLAAAAKAALATAPVPAAPGEDSPAESVAGPESSTVPAIPEQVEDPALTTLREAVAAVEAIAARDSIPYRSLLANRTFYLEMAPLIAAQHFLRGWEGVAQPFTRVRGLVPSELLEDLPPNDWWAIGARAMTLTRVSESERKN